MRILIINQATKFEDCCNASQLFIMITQRYFVLSESTTAFCVLRIYYKNIESSWGTIPLNLKSEIPVSSVVSVAAVGSKIKKGIQFFLKKGITLIVGLKP